MLTPNVIFRANFQLHACAQSKNLYYSKRDVSTTVDMTSSRFSECRSTAILLPIFMAHLQKLGGGKKLAFARRQILQQSSTLIVHLYFSSTLSFCTFLKKYQKRGSRVRHSVLPLFKSRFATSFSRCTPRRSLLVAMLGVARTRCAQTSCHLFPSIARLLAVPPNAALPPLAGNYLLQ